MQSSAILSILAVVGFAAAQCESGVGENLRDLVVTIFEEEDGTGNAITYDLIKGSCFNVPKNDRSDVESMVKPYGLKCSLYSEDNCADDAPFIIASGQGMKSSFQHSDVENHLYSILCSDPPADDEDDEDEEEVPLCSEYRPRR